MKNIENYKQTKYYIHNQRIKPSNDRNELQTSSWLIAKLVGDSYEKYIPKYAKGELLDLGCGSVPLYDAYKTYIKSNICVDWSNTVHENSYLDIVTDLNADLPLEDERFDTILFSDVLEHLCEPRNMFVEMHRVLKRGGYIIMNSPFYYWLHEEPYDYFRYTEYWYKRVAEEQGFEVVTLERIGGGIDVLTDIKMKLLCLLLPNTILARGYQKIYYHFFRKMYPIRKLNEIKQFTLGYFIVLRKK